ncbi:MAG: RAMP superfamily CRISPR-associated protein [Methanosarcinales archaeon]
MLYQLSGIITALSPLHFGIGKRKGTFSPTLDYIQGRTLRGMLGYYLYKNNKDLFNALGISEDKDLSKCKILFKNAYPRQNNKNAIASPLKYKWCKNCNKLLKAEECECLQEGKKVSGFITEDSLKNGILESIKVDKQIETKCPITRKGHASPSDNYELSPYHIEGIVPKTQFAFKCLVEEEYIEKVKDALRQAGVYIGVGGFRSRGYGTIAFNNFNTETVDTIAETRANEISKIKNKLLVANSNIIFRNGNKSYIGFDKALFKKYANESLKIIGFQPSEFSLNNQSIKDGIARGWTLKYGNKVSELIPCIGMGSCVEIECDAIVLSALEVIGIGSGIQCGYGEVKIYDST